MQTVLPEYEVYAIRYARMPRQRRDNFLGGDPHDGDMPMDFFVWLIRGAGRVVLVDTGFNADMARMRRRELIQCPIAALAPLGVQPEDVQHVVLTHLHYDHAGNLDLLPRARFHVQDDELDYATGRCMCFEPLRHAYAVEDVVTLVRRVYDGRVQFHDGDRTLLPGSNCCTSAATRKACKRCACIPNAAGWCWRRTPVITTRTWGRAGRFRSSTTRPRCCRATRSYMARRNPISMSCPGMTRWCWIGIPSGRIRRMWRCCIDHRGFMVGRNPAKRQWPDAWRLQAGRPLPGSLTPNARPRRTSPAR